MPRKNTSTYIIKIPDPHQKNPQKIATNRYNTNPRINLHGAYVCEISPAFFFRNSSGKIANKIAATIGIKKSSLISISRFAQIYHHITAMIVSGTTNFHTTYQDLINLENAPTAYPTEANLLIATATVTGIPSNTKKLNEISVRAPQIALTNHATHQTRNVIMSCRNDRSDSNI